MQTQNGVNMASGTATTAPSTATTAPSTAPLQLAGPSTMEHIVPINVQLVTLDTPSVIQGTKPGVSDEQTMQSTQKYATLPYVPGPTYTAPLPSTAPLPYAAGTSAVCYHAFYVNKAYFTFGLLWSGQSVPFCA